VEHALGAALVPYGPVVFRLAALQHLGVRRLAA